MGNPPNRDEGKGRSGLPKVGILGDAVDGSAPLAPMRVARGREAPAVAKTFMFGGTTPTPLAVVVAVVLLVPDILRQSHANPSFSNLAIRSGVMLVAFFS